MQLRLVLDILGDPYLPKGFFPSLAPSKILSLIFERREPFPCAEGGPAGVWGSPGPSGVQGRSPWQGPGVPERSSQKIFGFLQVLDAISAL